MSRDRRPPAWFTEDLWVVEYIDSELYVGITRDACQRYERAIRRMLGPEGVVRRWDGERDVLPEYAWLWIERAERGGDVR